MDSFFGLKVCRVCLKPNSVEELSQLDGDIGKIFREIAEFKISNGNEAAICVKCCKVVKKCYEFVEDTRGYEELVFEPMRTEYDAILKNPDARNSGIDIDFEACRVCLMPISVGPLESAMTFQGKLARMLRMVTGVDWTKEGKVHNVLICSSCSKTLQQAVHLKFVIKQNNDVYFEKFKAMRCVFCKKVFCSTANLRRHLKYCKLSGASTSEQSTGKSDVSLKRLMPHSHRASSGSKHMEEPCNRASEPTTTATNKFLCWCKKSFDDKNVLKLHKKICTSYN